MLAAGHRCGFYEFNRRAGDFAMAMALGTLSPRRRQNRRAAACGRRRRGQSAAHRRSRARARRRRCPATQAFRAAAAAATAADRSDGGHHHQRRIPPRPRPRRDAPGARTRGEVVSDPLAAPSPASRRRTEWIGQSVERLEDPPLVAGRGAFAGDINFPHQLHMRMVRSAHAHGRIVSIDTAAARALPGVFAVWTAADIAEVPPIDFREGSHPGARSVSPAGAGERPRALCRRAGRRGVCRRSLRRRGRRRSRRDGDRGTAAAARRAGRAGRVFAGPFAARRR